jgi:hypothetical protein
VRPREGVGGLQEADAEDEEQEERLALQAPPETSLTLAPQLELVDGKLVPKVQSMMVQAQAQPSYRRVTEYNSIINNNSHGNRMQSERWSPDETEAFFSVTPPPSSCSLGLPFACVGGAWAPLQRWAADFVGYHV